MIKNYLFITAFFGRKLRFCLTRKVCLFGLQVICFGINANKVYASEAENFNTIAQERINGTVTDSNNVPIPGANVLVVGTAMGTATDFDGKYSINVSESQTLEFSYLGYISQRVLVGSQKSINIVLKEDLQQLNEVVLIGYGSVKKSDLTASISTISPKDFKNQPIVTSTEILKGRTAGVTVSEPSGAPGGDFKIRIRGANSILGGNDPLIVIDGIQVGIGLGQINPKDIESMQILKDASSTAIYGSRGANGVVLITTKKGKEGLTVVEYNSQISLKSGSNPFKMMDPVLYAETVNLSTGGAAYSQSAIDNLRINGGSDMYEAILQSGFLQSHELSVRGGSSSTKFSVSGRYDDEDGVLVGTNFKKVVFNANISTKINDKIDLGVNFTGVQSKSHNIANSYNEVFMAPLWGPAEPIFNPDGSYNVQDPYSSFSANPVMLLNAMNRDNTTTTGVVSADLSYNILPGLTFKTIVGLNEFFGENAFVNDEVYALSPNVGGTTGAGKNLNRGHSWQITNTLTYVKTLADIHDFTLLAGFEQSENKSDGFNADGSELSPTSVGYNNLSLNSVVGIGSYFSNGALRSYFGRLGYILKDRYLLTATLRSDGSSKFRGDNQYSYFPSVGLGWKLSEEDFIKNMDVFSNLKLRGTWGITGNQAIDPYGTLNLLTQSNYGYGTGTVYPGYRPQGTSNPNLKWEETTQIDIGLDASFFNNRLSFTFDAYKKSTSGLLQAVAIPQYNGGGNVFQNIGEIENKGLEIAVNAVPVRYDDFQWDLAFNWSYSENEVVSVGDEDFIFPGESYGGGSNKLFIVKPGEPLGTFYGYKWLGIWRQSEAAEAALFGVKPGDNKFEDLNGDKLIDGKDNQVIGSAIPKVRMGLNTNLVYKNVTLNVFLESAIGGKTYNVLYSKGTTLSSDGKAVTLADGADYWTPTNDDAQFANILSDTYNAFQNTSQWLQDASYLRLRNISLSHDLSKELTSLADLRLFISAQNLFTITNYKGVNPENSVTSGSDVDTGLDYGTYPVVKTFTTGITVTF